VFDLIDRIEKRGRAGAPIGIGLGVLLVGLAIGLLLTSFTTNSDSRWVVGGLRGGAFLAIALGTIFGMVGARLLTARQYPPPEEIFPSLSADDFKAAIYIEPRPVCACAVCLIYLPAQYSSGSCPRCQSSLDWYEIATDEDADLVLSAVG